MMNQKQPFTINVSSPAAFSGQGSLIVLEYTDEETAMKVARKIARGTGRRVTVHGDMGVIDTIPAVAIH
jgi:formate-dependent phosphoribosylglycinamide formyltransferase (GAR transformylase)